MQPHTQVNQTQPHASHIRIVLLYGLSFGLFAAIASTANLLVSAGHAADYFRSRVPWNGLGFSDYIDSVYNPETYFLRQALPTGGLILACVFLGALLAARKSHQFGIGMGVAFIILLLSFVLYMFSCAAVARFVLDPALGFNSSLVTDSLGENTLVGLVLVVLTSSVGATGSVLGIGI